MQMPRIRYWFLLLMLFSSSSFSKITILKIGAPEDFACAHQAFFGDLSRQHQYRVEVKISPFKDVAEEFNAGNIDVSVHGMSNINVYTPLDKAVPSKPYLEVKRGFTVKIDSSFATSGKLPRGSKVAVMERSTAYDDLVKHYPDRFQLVLVKKLESTTRELLDTGKVDAVAEGYTGFWFNPDDAKRYKMIDVHPLDPEHPDKESLVYWVSKKKSRLLENINQLLAKVENPYRYYQENGTCHTRFNFPD